MMENTQKNGCIELSEEVMEIIDKILKGLENRHNPKYYSDYVIIGSFLNVHINAELALMSIQADTRRAREKETDK